MLDLLIAITIIYLFVRQFYGERAERWQARGRACLPILRYLKADILALKPRRKERVYTDKEIRKMLNL